MEAAAAALSVAPRVTGVPYNAAYLAAMGRWASLLGGRRAWPTPYAVDVLGRPQVLEDGWSRRELSWRPEVSSFAEGLAGLADRLAQTMPRPPPGAVAPHPGPRAAPDCLSSR
jgi:hypothetical protein